MLLVLFGWPGVGKNYVGNILAHRYQFHFYDADDALTAELRTAVKNKQLFAADLRAEYFAKVAQTITILKQKHPKLVVTQALATEADRQQLYQAHLDGHFIQIEAALECIEARIIERNNWVDLDYAHRIIEKFEPAQMPHLCIDNNHDTAHVEKQLTALLPQLASVSRLEH